MYREGLKQFTFVIFLRRGFSQLACCMALHLSLQSLGMNSKKLPARQPTSYQDLMQHFQKHQSGDKKQLQLRKQKFLSKSTSPDISLMPSQHQEWDVGATEGVPRGVLTAHNRSINKFNCSARGGCEGGDKEGGKEGDDAYNRFVTEVTSILVDLLGETPPALLLLKIPYLKYLETLKELRIISTDYEPHEKDLVMQLWADHVKQSNVGEFILKLATILKVSKYQSDQLLQINYSQLRSWRMDRLGMDRLGMDRLGMKRKDRLENRPFCPSISNRSRTLAGSRSASQKKINRSCQKHNQSMGQTDRVSTHEAEMGKENSKLGNIRSEILYRQAKERSQQKRIDRGPAEIQYQKSRRELTFNPKISGPMKTSKTKQVQGEQSTISRIIRGRVERQVRNLITQKGLPHNQKVFEKMRQERYELMMEERKKAEQSLRQRERASASMANANTSNTVNIHTLSRISEADAQIASPSTDDLQKQFEEIFKSEEIGEAEKEAKRIVLDIYLDETRCVKLVIQKNESYQTSAFNFVKQHGLSQEMHAKLLKELESAMKFQLTQIDEDSFEEDTEGL